MKTVSVVIPAYNASPFIEKCINSILSQSFKDFEIVVVNDGSTDNTLQILETLHKKDERIRIITQKNGGVSSARNTGLKNATGKFVTFVDADDALLPTALDDMVAVMGDTTDFAVFSHNEVKLTSKPHLEKPCVYKAEELDEKFIEFDRVIWWPWAKMLRRSVIEENHLEYDTSLSFGEDHIFNLLFAKHIKGNVVVSDKVVYNYYYIRGGLCSKYYPDMNELQKYIYLKIEDYFGDIPRKYQKHYVGCYFKGCMDYYIAWCDFKNAKERISDTVKVYSDVIDDEILKEYFSPKQYQLLKDENFGKFIFDYTLHNPRQTVIRKILRKIRRLLEAILKFFIKLFKK